jgi:hypothetical protein
MAKKITPAKTAITEQQGVHAVALLFTKKLEWLFREQPVSDFGIDAIVEVVDDDGPSGQLIALQIKSGPSFFSREKKDSFTFKGEMRHLEYWTRHSLPVFLIIHNPITNTTLWQKIERRLCKVNERSWNIEVPKLNVLDQTARYHFSKGIPSDDEARRRFAFSVDLDLMPRFANDDVLMTWELWQNKGLSLRNGKFIFPDGTEEDVFGWYTTRDINLAMDRLYPWLAYNYGHVDWEVYGEADVYTLHLSLKPAARAYMEAEQFFKTGDSEPPPEQPKWEESDED